MNGHLRSLFRAQRNRSLRRFSRGEYFDDNFVILFIAIGKMVVDRFFVGSELPGVDDFPRALIANDDPEDDSGR